MSTNPIEPAPPNPPEASEAAPARSAKPYGSEEFFRDSERAFAALGITMLPPVEGAANSLNLPPVMVTFVNHPRKPTSGDAPAAPAP